MEFGTETNHVFTFYYGQDHLLFKASDFLKKGLKENEKCFYCFKDRKGDELLNRLKQKDLKTKQLLYLDIEKIVTLYLKQGKKALKNELVKLVKQAKKEGYKRVRILNSPLTAKEILTDEKLIVWERVLDEILMKIDGILILCPYNVRSLINEKKNKSEIKFIKDALKVHTSLLSAEEIYQINDEFNITI